MKGDYGGQPPHDIDAEQVILGAMMTSPAAVADVAAAGVTPGSYYRPAHQVIASVISALAGRGDPHDPVAVRAELEARGETRNTGGATYLHDLFASVASPGEAGYYARIVANHEKRRRLAEIGRRIAQAAEDKGTSLEAVHTVCGELASSNGHGPVVSRYTPVNWHEAFAAQPAAVQWLHEPLLEAGTVNALFGPPESWKSLLALEIAVRLVRQGRVVVYIDEENRLTDLVERLQAFGCTPDELDRLRLYSFASLPPLDTVPGGQHLLALATADGADLVILDTTSRMVEGNENDADTFLKMYKLALVPLKARGITSWRLDHPGKDQSRGQRGSSAKDGDVDTVWQLTKLTENTRRQERRKSRQFRPAEVTTAVLRKELKPRLHLSWLSGTGDPAVDLARKLDDLGVPLGTGRDAVRRVLLKNDVHARNDVISAAIRYRQKHAEPVRDSPGTGGQLEF